MAKTPTKSEIRHLQAGINWSYKQLKPFRKNDINAMKQYVGANYSNKGADKKVPFSLLELAINIYTQRLSGGRAKALFTTPHRELYPQKAKLQRGTNHLLDEIDFQKSFADVVQGGFFSMGIMKTGLAFQGQFEWNGFLHDHTQPFADSVVLPNWVHDMTATRWDKVQFCGDRYSMDLEDARERYGDSGVKLRAADERAASDDRTEELSQGQGYNREYYRQITEVWDIWDPKENRIIVLEAGEGSECDITGDYLDSYDWNGPERGPYRLLKFTPVRGNIMPLAPVALWRDFHDLSNNIMRKLERQARRQKSFIGVRPGGNADGRTAQQANDGGVYSIADSKNIVPMNIPGIDPNLLAFLIQAKNMASWIWGNLDALGGLSPQSETLGQDRLLTASASQRLIRMQNTVLDFATEVIRALAEFLYTDPYIVMPQTKRYGDISIPVYWTPEDREQDFLEYNMKIEPYSLQYRSPSERLETIRQTLVQLMMPLAQQMMAQGVFVDIEGLFKIVGEYSGVEELKDILIYTNPRHGEEGPVRAMQSPVTSRTNTRVNRPGATSQGKDEAMVSHLLGQGQQQSQLNQITRPTG